MYCLYLQVENQKEEMLEVFQLQKISQINRVLGTNIYLGFGYQREHGKHSKMTELNIFDKLS